MPPCRGSPTTDCVGSLTFSKGKQYIEGEWKNGRTHRKVTRDTGDGNKYVGELEKFILYLNKAGFSIFSRGSLKIGLYFFSNRCTLWFSEHGQIELKACTDKKNDFFFSQR